MRQGPPQPIDPKVKPARGLLHQTRSFEHFELTRFEPSADLAEHVEHHWLILWDLTGKPPYRQQNLSHPTQHMVLNPQDRSGLFGMATGTFTYVLERSGRVLGTKFRPGAFHSFYGQPVSALTDSVVPIRMAFRRDDQQMVAEFAALNDPASMVRRIEAMLREHLRPLDAKARQARLLVELIEEDFEVISVAELARRASTTARSLQRLFERYVGVGPKWVIDRYRMIEAVEALNRGEEVSLAELAVRLGYYDQAHQVVPGAHRGRTGSIPRSLKHPRHAWS